MTTGLRRRVLTLQVGLVGILAFVAGFLFWANSFTHNQVRDELTAQQIYFPASDSAAVKALPASDAAAMRQYASQQLVTGDQAQTYANSFIAVHLRSTAGGLTYSQASAKAQANPNDTKLAGQVQTLFRGETLRGLLLNAYGWWTVGQYAFYAAIGLVVAACAVFAALLFEVWRWAVAARTEKVAVSAVSAGAPQPTVV